MPKSVVVVAVLAWVVLTVVAIVALGSMAPIGSVEAGVIAAASAIIVALWARRRTRSTR